MATPAEVGLAFGLVIAAGFATCLGACVALCVKVTDTRLLACALGASAGVMLYVSFVEIFSVKAVQGFEDAGYTSDQAYRYSTLMFFGGMAMTFCLNQVAHFLVHASERCDPCWRRRGTESKEQNLDAAVRTPSDLDTGRKAASDPELAPSELAAERDPPTSGACPCSNAAVVLALPADDSDAPITSHKGLTRMGLLSALAIGIHNFPEGLATFVGTLADPRAGVGIAVAIALHNIPEGIVVSLPIMYATGSKWKGILWSVVCGLSEPLAGLVGWLILRGEEANPLMYGAMFSLVAGMMVYISLQELIPTALSYDTCNRFTTRGLFVGMAVMAVSLLLFTI